MNIDLHIHTNQYSFCSYIDPIELIFHVKETELDGIVITEHDVLWPYSERKKLLSLAEDILLLWGIEMSCRDGLHYLVYFDLNNEKLDLYGNMDQFDMFSKVHEVGGVVIPAHIFRYGRNVTNREISNLQIDGIEVKSINIDSSGMRKSIEVAQKLNLCQIAGSDAHTLDKVGKYYTKFDMDIKNERDLVSAIKNNKCRPIIDNVLQTGTI